MSAAAAKIIPLRRPVLRRTPHLNQDLATHMVGETWISMVSRILINTSALGHPEVVRTLGAIEGPGRLEELRCQYRVEIEELISALLGSPFEKQAELRREAGATVAALALDLVQRITFRLVETTRADQQANVAVIQPLVELFHHLLRDDLDSCR